MKLSQVLAGVETEATTSATDSIEITMLTSDSRDVQPGALFIALPGTKTDGNRFISEAIHAGAVAVVTEKRVPDVQVPVFKVPAARKAVALIAGNFYGNPARELVLLGVTGTNGKTTVTWLVESICLASMSSVGLMGTIAVRFAGKSHQPIQTTFEPILLHRTLREMLDGGADTVVMEVSSHALDQQRVHGLTFRAAGFSSFSRDHFDYHPDMEAYFQAKRRLFTECLSAGGLAVVNGEDTYTNRIYSEMRQLKRQAWKFSRFGNGELSAAQVELTARGIMATLKTPAGDIPIKSKLLGAHNLDNILLATGIALAAGASRRDVQDGIERVTRIPGRMERLEGRGITALVDYAHTSEALGKALEAARSLTNGKLIVVFGCGGERDAGKRPMMGKEAAQADLPIITSDNPRGENPADIISEIVPGLERSGFRRMSPAKARSGEKGYLVETDRASAIALALSLAREGDTVLVAGKGHEVSQEHAGHKKPFDDFSEIRKALG